MQAEEIDLISLLGFALAVDLLTFSLCLSEPRREELEKLTGQRGQMEMQQPAHSLFCMAKMCEFSGGIIDHLGSWFWTLTVVTFKVVAGEGFFCNKRFWEVAGTEGEAGRRERTRVKSSRSGNCAVRRISGIFERTPTSVHQRQCLYNC